MRIKALQIFGLLLLMMLNNACISLVKLENLFKNYKLFEGSWRYKVKVRNVALINPQAFTPEFFENPDYSSLKGRNFSFGHISMKEDDDFYTGYLNLFADPSKCFEIDGGYFPDRFSAPGIFTPLEIQEIKPSEDHIQLTWKVDLRQRNAMPFNVFWLTRAYYLRKQDILTGTTLVLSCSEDKCDITNIVRWKADRVPEISYYDQHNYSTKGMFYELVRPLDPKGVNTKKFFDWLSGSPSNEQRVHSSLKQSYSKVTLSAMLPVLAGTSGHGTNLQLDDLCDPNFCPTRAQFYNFAGKNYDERVADCQKRVSLRNLLCCDKKAIRDNGLCDCRYTNRSGATTSLCCCRILNVDCVTESKTQQGQSIRYKKDVVRYTPDGANGTLTLPQDARIAILIKNTAVFAQGLVQVASLVDGALDPTFFVQGGTPQGTNQLLEAFTPPFSSADILGPYD